MVDDGLEERPQVGPGRVEIARGRAGTRARVEHRELDLLFACVEIDEEVVDLVQHLPDSCVRAIDLVDDDHRRQPPLETLSQDEPRLRQRPLGRVHEQHDPVHHGQRALDFPAEVGVARRIDDVDQQVLIVDSCVLGEDGDTTLALERVAVHHPIDDPLVRAKDAALVQHRVDQRRFPVIDMSNDGDVAEQRVGDTQPRL